MPPQGYAALARGPVGHAANVAAASDRREAPANSAAGPLPCRRTRVNLNPGLWPALGEESGQVTFCKLLGERMAIGNAVQRGSIVYIYDEKGRQTAAVSAGSGRGDGLKGYTNSTVNVQRGSIIYSHDEKGRQIAAVVAR
jgi:hypothetical protein